MSAPAYTYETDAQPCQALNMSKGGAMFDGFRARVRRQPDGAIVWFGDIYTTPGKAKAQAGRIAARYRGYYAAEGACFHDREQAVKAHAKARKALRMELLTELRDAISHAATAAMEGQGEEANPYSADSAQGITWTQANALMRDRLSDWTDENPEPVQP